MVWGQYSKQSGTSLIYKQTNAHNCIHRERETETARERKGEGDLHGLVFACEDRIIR